MSTVAGVFGTAWVMYDVSPKLTQMIERKNDFILKNDGIRFHNINNRELIFPCLQPELKSDNHVNKSSIPIGIIELT